MKLAELVENKLKQNIKWRENTCRISQTEVYVKHKTVLLLFGQLDV